MTKDEQHEIIENALDRAERHLQRGDKDLAQMAINEAKRSLESLKLTRLMEAPANG